MSAPRGEVVVRPDGRLYRAKRGPHAELLDDGDEGIVIVWRTHDIDVATALAGHLWGWESGSELPPVDTVGWFKTVPWDALGLDCDWTVIDGSPARDTPAVTFRSPGVRRW